MSERTQGLIHKFDVRRTDGSSAPGKKHDGCDYFVLDVTHDPFALPALAAYAKACATTYAPLARDLIDKLAKKGVDVAELILVARADPSVVTPTASPSEPTPCRHIVAADRLDDLGRAMREVTPGVPTYQHQGSARDAAVEALENLYRSLTGDPTRFYVLDQIAALRGSFNDFVVGVNDLRDWSAAWRKAAPSAR